MINYLRTHPTQLRLVTPKAQTRKQTWSTSPSSSWIDQAYTGLIDDTRLYLAYWKLLMRVILITYSASKARTRSIPICFGRNSIRVPWIVSRWRKKVKYPHAHYFSSNLCLFNYISAHILGFHNILCRFQVPVTLLAHHNGACSLYLLSLLAAHPSTSNLILKLQDIY